MGIRELFKRRPDRFVSLLAEQSDLTLKGLDLLTAYMGGQAPEAARQIADTEKQADEVRRILIDDLNRTFVTSIDREDIFSLSRSIDDMLDYGNTTVDEMEILSVRPTEHMQRIASLLRDAAFEIHMSVLRLQDNHPQVANDHAQHAKALENRVETVYREALANLFSGPQDLQHVVQMLKMREVYRHLSNAADQGDAAANVIADIVVKMA